MSDTIEPTQNGKRRSSTRARAGGPASGIPAMGKGWGGPAKGAGSPEPNRQWTREEATQMSRELAHTPEAKLKRLGTIASREEAMTILSDSMRTATQEAVAGMLADKLLDRIEGKPKQKTEITGTLTLEALLEAALQPAQRTPLIESAAEPAQDES